MLTVEWGADSVLGACLIDIIPDKQLGNFW